MKISAIWQAHRQSVRNAWRDDSGVRMAWLVRGVLFLGAGWWLFLRLTNQLKAWQSQGTPSFTLHVLFLYLAVWVAIGAFAMLGAFQQGFSTDEATVLLLLPLPPATRFRILLLQVLLKRVGQWLVLVVVLVGGALAVVLEGRSLLWVGLLLGGMFTFTALGTWLVVVAIRHLTGHRLPGLLLLLGAGAVLVVWGFRVHILTWPMDAPAWLPPLLAAGLLVTVGFMAGPLAKPIGATYEAAFHVEQDHSGPRTRAYLPGSNALSTRVSRRRTLIGALLFKSILNQSRNPLLLVRLGMVVSSILLFPLVKPMLFLHYHLPDRLLVLGYLALIMSLTVSEAAVNAIAGEGERLTLYLTAPISPNGYLWSKFVVTLLPVFSLTTIVSVALVGQARLPLGDTILVLAELYLCQLGGIGLLVWCSAWDADLNTLVEGPAQTMLQEDASISPRRLMLVNINLALQLLYLAVVWALPKWPGLLALSLLDAAVLSAAWSFAHRQLERLVLDP